MRGYFWAIARTTRCVVARMSAVGRTAHRYASLPIESDGTAA